MSEYRTLTVVLDDDMRADETLGEIQIKGVSHVELGAIVDMNAVLEREDVRQALVRDLEKVLRRWRDRR